MMQLSSRAKRILKWVGYPILAVVVFVLAVHWSLPYDRVKDKLAEKLSNGYNVYIGATEGSFLPGGLAVEDLVLRAHDAKEGDRPIVDVASAEFDVGMLGLLSFGIGGELGVDTDIKLGDGSLSGEVRWSKKRTVFTLDGGAVDVEKIPYLSSLISFPLFKQMKLSGQLELKRFKLSQATGTIKVACPGCVLGDGVATWDPCNAKRTERSKERCRLSTRPVLIPPLDLGDFSGELQFENGRLNAVNMKGGSEDGEVQVEGYIDFKPSKPKVSLCFRYKFTETLRKRAEVVEAERRKELQKAGKKQDFAPFSSLAQLLESDDGEDGFRESLFSGTLASARMTRPKGKCRPGQTAKRRRAPKVRVRRTPDRKKADSKTADERERSGGTLKDRKADRKGSKKRGRDRKSDKRADQRARKLRDGMQPKPGDDVKQPASLRRGGRDDDGDDPRDDEAPEGDGDDPRGDDEALEGDGDDPGDGDDERDDGPEGDDIQIE